MKKKALLIVVLCMVLVSAFALSACNKDGDTPEPYTYTPSDEFINISVTFGGGSGATTRTFNFSTLHQSYDDRCYVQLDPAEQADSAPAFNTKDNFSVLATSAQFPYALETKKRSLHTAYVTNLAPDTKYFYRVGCPQEEKWSDWGSFTTDDCDGSFTFLHITDAQAETAEEYAALTENLRKALAENPEIEFILSTGDQAENGFVPIPGVWDDFFASIQTELMRTTFAPVLGNHEISDTFNAFFPIPGFTDTYSYSYEYGDCLFIFLDTNKSSLSAQFAWADEIINNSNKTWKIVAMHRTPYSAGTHADDAEIQIIKQEIVPFAASRGIDLVLSGHDHIYARTYPLNGLGEVVGAEQVFRGENKVTYTNPYGVIYAENRCVGSKFYNKNSMNDAYLEVVDPGKVTKPVYSTVTIDGNKLTYTSYEYDSTGTKTTSIIDCFEIIKTE